MFSRWLQISCRAVFTADEVGTMLFTPQLQINSGEGLQARWRVKIENGAAKTVQTNQCQGKKPGDRNKVGAGCGGIWDKAMFSTVLSGLISVLSLLTHPRTFTEASNALKFYILLTFSAVLATWVHSGLLVKIPVVLLATLDVDSFLLGFCGAGPLIPLRDVPGTTGSGTTAERGFYCWDYCCCNY